MRNLIYLRPTLYDLSQGTRIKFISVLPFDLAKRDKRYIEQYIIEAIKSYSIKRNN